MCNGKVYTMDESCPLAEAVAVHGNRIVAVGKSEEIRKRATLGTVTIDLQGKTVVPGFTDAHVHLVSYSLAAEQVDLNEARTLEEAVERVRRRVVELGEGKWVLGRGWDSNLWHRSPRKEDLDTVLPRNPVALHSKDGHTLWVNSVVLFQAGIDKDTCQPKGGEIERDEETGEATGLLREKAQSLVDREIPEPTVEEVEAAVLKAIKEFQRVGITAVTDLEGDIAFRVLQNLLSQGKLGLRVSLVLPAADIDAIVKLGIQSGFGNEKLRIAGVKILADGTLGSGTAAMLEAYEDDPANRGIMRFTENELCNLVHRAVSNGLSVAVHCIGDKTNRTLLDIFEANLNVKSYGSRLRHRNEHAQHLAEVDVKRFGKLGVIASVQPIHIALDMNTMKRRLGKRGRWAYPFRTLLDSGAVLAFGSDSPVERFNPFLGIYTAVTRRRGSNDEECWHAEECISVEEAVRAYTIAGAFAACEENQRGTISQGKLADMVVLSKNIFEIPYGQVKEVEVEMTIFDGEIVYRKGTTN